MLEKPAIADELLLTALRSQYDLTLRTLDFLPLGADQNTAVYRAGAFDGTDYFVKLRSGEFVETSVTLPKFLHDAGIREIISPLTNLAGGLWAVLDGFTLILYPFVDGENAYARHLTDAQWTEFGATVRHIHTLQVPPTVTDLLPRETYSPLARARVKGYLEQAENDLFEDALATRCAAFLNTKRDRILELVERTDSLANHLMTRALPFVICHADLHAGNILIEDSGSFYIVDWDTVLLAPQERDLMYAGGSQFLHSRPPAQEEALFYEGYGAVEVNQTALAYYRYERIVQDLMVECELILNVAAPNADREREFRFMQSNFDSNGALETAQRADTAPP